MENKWDAESIKQSISGNIERLCRNIDKIKKMTKDRPSYDQELSTLIGRLEANSILADDICLTTQAQFLDKLKKIPSTTSVNAAEVKSQKHFILGLKCEIEILKAIANK